jgi:dCMP deaminase
MSDSGKRKTYLSWEDTIMYVAKVLAQRSKDPNTQVGCCIVDDKHRIIGSGYNGFPRGCDDDKFPWTKSNNSLLMNKYGYVVHAEQNAILNSCRMDLNGSTMYVTQHPCNECAKFIIQSGIKHVIYNKNPLPDSEPVLAAIYMFQEAGISVRQYICECDQLLLHGS